MATSRYFKAPSRPATRKAPVHEIEDDTSDAPSSPKDLNESLEKLLVEVSKMSSTLSTVATDVSTIKQTTAELKTTVTAIQERLEEAEERIAHLEDSSERLVNDSSTRNKQVDVLWNRVQTLENQSRRNNVRLVGLKETYGTNGTLSTCIQRILKEGLELDTGGEFEIERVHRQPTPMLNSDQPPRPVLIRFLRQSARDKVINVVKGKRGIVWEDCRLLLFPDMSKELSALRKTFTPAKRRLQELDVSYSLTFPATLRFKWNGKNESFTNAEAADRFINEHCH